MRHFTRNSCTYFFGWNNASQQDWKKIEGIFIAAFMHSCANIPLPHLKTPESILTAWDQAYQKYYPTSNANAFIKDIFKPLQRFFPLIYPQLSVECGLIRKHFADPSSVQLKNIKTKVCHFIHFFSYLKEYFDEEYNKIMTKSTGNSIHYLVSYFEDQPVAFFTAEHNWKTGRAYVRLATVSPRFHKQGIGRFMIDEICRHFDTKGVDLIVRKQNYSAISFYLACGFKEMSELDFEAPNAAVEYKSMVRAYLNNPKCLPLPIDESVSDPSQFTGFRL